MKSKENSVHSSNPDEARHPIQVVSRRTGLSADVIRVWERRYAAVTPNRIAGGRRVYSDEDIRRLALLQRVTDAGRRISDVANLGNDALLQLVDEDRRGAGLPFNQGGSQSGSEAHIVQALQAIEALDPDRLRQVIATAASELPLAHFLEQMVTPLLRQIGDHWKTGEIRVGQEHMASMVIRHYLMALLNRSTQNGPAMVFTTPPGQQHELGVLMAAVTAESEGWSALYLGADMPAEEIAATVATSHAKAVALGIQSSVDEQRLLDELERLRIALPENVPLIISGQYARQHRLALAKLPALIPDSLSEFREILTAIQTGIQA